VHCRYYAVQLNDAHEEIEATGARIVVIGQATPRHAAHFQRRYAPNLYILADEKRETYKAMGIPRGSATELIGPKSVTSGVLRSVRTGVVQGRTIGDAAQLGATMIVLPGGEIAWSHYASDASDNPTVDELKSALAETLS
jgi:AhpC/TSA antioxidant enzyme